MMNMLWRTTEDVKELQHRIDVLETQHRDANTYMDDFIRDVKENIEQILRSFKQLQEAIDAQEFTLGQVAALQSEAVSSAMGDFVDEMERQVKKLLEEAEDANEETVELAQRLEGEVENLDSRAESLRSDYDNLESKVADLEGDINFLADRISELEEARE